jgi:hypothetical protein
VEDAGSLGLEAAVTAPETMVGLRDDPERRSLVRFARSATAKYTTGVLLAAGLVVAAPVGAAWMQLPRVWAVTRSSTSSASARPSPSASRQRRRRVHSSG